VLGQLATGSSTRSRLIPHDIRREDRGANAAANPKLDIERALPIGCRRSARVDPRRQGDPANHRTRWMSRRGSQSVPNADGDRDAFAGRSGAVRALRAGPSIAICGDSLGADAVRSRESRLSSRGCGGQQPQHPPALLDRWLAVVWPCAARHTGPRGAITTVSRFRSQSVGRRRRSEGRPRHHSGSRWIYFWRPLALTRVCFGDDSPSSSPAVRESSRPHRRTTCCMGRRARFGQIAQKVRELRLCRVCRRGGTASTRWKPKKKDLALPARSKSAAAGFQHSSPRPDPRFVLGLE